MEHLNAKQAAKILQCSQHTVYRLCDTGVLEYAHHTSGTRKFRRIVKDSVERRAAEMGLPAHKDYPDATPAPTQAPKPELLTAWDRLVELPAAVGPRSPSIREAAEILFWAIVRRFTR